MPGGEQCCVVLTVAAVRLVFDGFVTTDVIIIVVWDWSLAHVPRNISRVVVDPSNAEVRELVGRRQALEFVHGGDEQRELHGFFIRRVLCLFKPIFDISATRGLRAAAGKRFDWPGTIAAAHVEDEVPVSGVDCPGRVLSANAYGNNVALLQ